MLNACAFFTTRHSLKVALNGLENILRLGEQESKQDPESHGVNSYAVMIEECYGLDKIEFLQVRPPIYLQDVPHGA